MRDKRQMGGRGARRWKRRKDSEKSKKRKMGQEGDFLSERVWGKRRGGGERKWGAVGRAVNI